MKRKAAQSKSGSRARPLEPSAPPGKAARGSLYSEATGKIVDYIRYTDQPGGWPAFEIRFADGTFLFIEPLPRVQFRVRFLKAEDGNIKTLRDYGVVPEAPNSK